MIRYIFICIGLIITCSCVGQEDRNQLEAQRGKIIKEIEATSDLLKSTAKEKNATLEDYRILENQIKKRENLISNINKSISSGSKQIDQNQAKIDSLNQSIEQLKSQYSQLIRTIHIKRNTGLSWSHFLSFSSLNEAFRKWRQTKQFEQYVGEKKSELASISSQIIEENLKLANNLRERTDMLTDEQRQRNKLDKEKDTKNKMLKSLKSQESTLKAKLKKHKKEREKFNKAIENVILNSLKAKKNNEVASPKYSGIAFPKLKGKMAWPSNGTITARFGNNPHPTLKNVKVANNGVDISSSKTMKIKVVADGTVVAVSKIAGYENMIIIQHGDYYTVYSKVTEVHVSGGQDIKAGSHIGTINSPENGKYSLHFELWKDKKKLNPETWLKR